MATQSSPDPTPICTFLRKANLATYPLAFALGIAHAATSHNGLFPAISLVPQTASLLFSGTVLYFDSQRRRHNPIMLDAPEQDTKRRIRNLVYFVGDFMIGASLLVCMVFSWINLPMGWYGYYGRYYGSDAGETMLGTYATVPFMINMLTHLFFALRAIYLSIPAGFFEAFTSTPVSSTCPNCHHNLAAVGPATRYHGDKNVGGYSFLNPDESDSLYRDIERQVGRPSADSARETGEGVGKSSEETAREMTPEDVAKILDV